MRWFFVATGKMIDLTQGWEVWKMASMPHLFLNNFHSFIQKNSNLRVSGNKELVWECQSARKVSIYFLKF